MRGIFVIAACVAAAGFLPAISRPANAEVTVNVSKSSQRMAVLVNGAPRYHWTVSTGKRRFTTPSGNFRPQRMERSWYSRQYHNAPMPHSIFFYKGYAIHGTTEIAKLGNVDSHGCVRLHPANAAALFALVQSQGMKNTHIAVSDKPLAPSAPMSPDAFVADKDSGSRDQGKAAARAAFAQAIPREKAEAGFHW
jgi:hypothetical protein